MDMGDNHEPGIADDGIVHELGVFDEALPALGVGSFNEWNSYTFEQQSGIFRQAYMEGKLNMSSADQDLRESLYGIVKEGFAHRAKVEYPSPDRRLSLSAKEHRIIKLNSVWVERAIGNSDNGDLSDNVSVLSPRSATNNQGGIDTASRRRGLAVDQDTIAMLSETERMAVFEASMRQTGLTELQELQNQALLKSHQAHHMAVIDRQNRIVQESQANHTAFMDRQDTRQQIGSMHNSLALARMLPLDELAEEQNVMSQMMHRILMTLNGQVADGWKSNVPQTPTTMTRDAARQRKHSKTAFFWLSLVLTFASLPWYTESLSSTNSNTKRRADYAAARQTRISLGHNNLVSQTKYRELLEKYPNDATTASHLAATALTPYHQRQVAQMCGSADFQRFRRCLVEARFNNYHVGLALGVRPDREGRPHQLSFAMSPIYVTPAAAGTLDHDKVDSITLTPVECIMALFLLGATVSRTRVQDLLGREFLDLAQSLSLLYPSDSDPDRLLATVQIFPVQFRSRGDDSFSCLDSSSSPSPPLYFMTDWHPRVLSQTKVADTDSNTSSDEAVMYLGPDSMALVQHFWYNHQPPTDEETNNSAQYTKCTLDFCTGSGIQALVGLAMNENAHVTCVDMSLRALYFVVANAQLNDIDPSRLQLIEGDLRSGRGRLWLPERDFQGNVSVRQGKEVELLQWLESGDKFDVITANPPFLPVPPDLMERHGKFSDGGGSGEDVLESIVRMSQRILGPTGILAVVSEFFLAPNTITDDDPASSWTADFLVDRIQKWWLDGDANDDGIKTKEKPCGFLLTNEFPIDRETYATRRADSKEEYDMWMEHLKNINMLRASPGFLFLKNGCVSAELEHRVAPQSSFGSLWTPSNPNTVTFTANLLEMLYKR
eukprot:scaffold34652_cov211-Amphora_coffeaeformis.AAC.5